MIVKSSIGVLNQWLNQCFIDEAFKSMDQSIVINNYACEDWIVFDVIIKHSIKIFEC